MGLKSLIMVMVLLTVPLDFLMAETAKKTNPSRGSERTLTKPDGKLFIREFEKDEFPKGLQTLPEQDECGEKFILLVKGKKIKTSLATFPNCYSLFISTNGAHPVIANVWGKFIRSGPVANQKKPAANPWLSNSDIIKLVKAVSEEFVTHFIRVTSCSFDLSPKGIEHLKSRKVPESVIQAMQDKMETEKLNTEGIY